MRILCRCGFLPTGLRWYCTSCNTRRMSTELPTHLGWTRRLLRMTYRRSGRRQGPIGGCSSRWATTSGTQGSTPCPLCGLMCLCWEPAICAGWSAMIFTTYGRSMMSQACGAISAHNGDYYSSIWKPRGLVGIPACRKRRAALYQQV